VPHALSDLQREYLEFIRQYIKANESSPRLDEIAGHFGVKPPTAHKMLETLNNKGFLYFARDKFSGFFIRLIERAGSAETVIEVPITGKVNKLGEIYDFPEDHGHFASVFIGANPETIFALAVMEDIPQASILCQDLLICDSGKKPQPGDICLVPFGKRWFLIRVQSKTYDKEIQSFVMRQEYPIPENLSNEELEQWLNWHPLAHNEDTHNFFAQVAEEQGIPQAPMPPWWAGAVVLRLTRHLAF